MKQTAPIGTTKLEHTVLWLHVTQRHRIAGATGVKLLLYCLALRIRAVQEPRLHRELQLMSAQGVLFIVSVGKLCHRGWSGLIDGTASDATLCLNLRPTSVNDERSVTLAAQGATKLCSWFQRRGLRHVPAGARDTPRVSKGLLGTTRAMPTVIARQLALKQVLGGNE